MPINIVDANNYFRRGFEAGKAVSTLAPQLNLDTTFYVFDGKFGTAKRKALYPNYKAKRDTQTPTDNGFFTYLSTIREELLPNCYNCIILQVDGYEADDIIAALATHFGDQQKPVLIHSNDADFQSLLNDYVSITDRSKKLAHVEPKDIRLYKTLVGDSSDNISGIPLLGNTWWAKLDEVVKTKWIELLEGKTETYPTDHLTEAKRLWISENIPLLRTFYTIVGFLPVDLSKVLTLNSVIGVNDPTAYRQTMTKYFWI
jgi:5'-3' exonuclease